MTVKKTGQRSYLNQQNLTTEQGKLEEQIRYDEANLPPWMPEGSKSPLRQLTEGGLLHDERQKILDARASVINDELNTENKSGAEEGKRKVLTLTDGIGKLRFVMKDGRAFIQFNHRGLKRWKTIFVIKQDGSLNITARITQNASLGSGQEPQ